MLKIFDFDEITASNLYDLVIYYLSSLDVQRERLTEGLLQGSCLRVVAALAYIISSELQNADIDVFFLSYCILVCGLTGFVIGWTFPEEYRRRNKNIMESSNRKIQQRISVYSAGTLRVSDEDYPCQTVGVSVLGAKLQTTVDEKIGTNILLTLQDIGPIKGILKRKDQKKLYLQFSPTSEMKKRLETFIGLSSDWQMSVQGA